MSLLLPCLNGVKGGTKNRLDIVTKETKLFWAQKIKFRIINSILCRRSSICTFIVHLIQTEFDITPREEIFDRLQCSLIKPQQKPERKCQYCELVTHWGINKSFHNTIRFTRIACSLLEWACWTKVHFRLQWPPTFGLGPQSVQIYFFMMFQVSIVITECFSTNIVTITELERKALQATLCTTDLFSNFESPFSLLFDYKRKTSQKFGVQLMEEFSTCNLWNELAEFCFVQEIAHSFQQPEVRFFLTLSKIVCVAL